MSNLKHKQQSMMNTVVKCPHEIVFIVSKHQRKDMMASFLVDKSHPLRRSSVDAGIATSTIMPKVLNVDCVAIIHATAQKEINRNC